MVHINILDDKLHEGEERLTIELTAFDLSIVLVNSITEIVIQDDDEGMINIQIVLLKSTLSLSFLIFYNEYFTIYIVVASEICTVELVGSIEVNGNSATYRFRGVGSNITRYICKLNGQILPDCK